MLRRKQTGEADEQDQDVSFSTNSFFSPTPAVDLASLTDLEHCVGQGPEMTERFSISSCVTSCFATPKSQNKIFLTDDDDDEPQLIGAWLREMQLSPEVFVSNVHLFLPVCRSRACMLCLVFQYIYASNVCLAASDVLRHSAISFASFARTSSSPAGCAGGAEIERAKPVLLRSSRYID